MGKDSMIEVSPTPEKSKKINKLILATIAFLIVSGVVYFLIPTGHQATPKTTSIQSQHTVDDGDISNKLLEESKKNSTTTSEQEEHTSHNHSHSHGHQQVQAEQPAPVAVETPYMAYQKQVEQKRWARESSKEFEQLNNQDLADASSIFISLKTASQNEKKESNNLSSDNSLSVNAYYNGKDSSYIRVIEK